MEALASRRRFRLGSSISISLFSESSLFFFVNHQPPPASHQNYQQVRGGTRHLSCSLASCVSEVHTASTNTLDGTPTTPVKSRLLSLSLARVRWCVRWCVWVLAVPAEARKAGHVLHNRQRQHAPSKPKVLQLLPPVRRRKRSARRSV
jgi:hypothetical protein